MIGLYFPVSMGFFQKNLDVRADVVFGAKVTQHRQIFRGCQPIEKTIFLTFMQHRRILTIRGGGLQPQI